jgi:CRISPR-associated endonuclease Csn1
MIERILGIDLGIASLGWAVVEHDKDNEANNRIIDCGVRLFTAAETPKEKESPNKARRDARGIRRVLNRRRVRMNEIKRLFIASGFIKNDDLDEDGGMFNSKANRADVWQLRYEALRRKLNGNELARVLVHIAKHRGYKFLGDDEADEESGKVKKAGVALKAEYESANCRTVGEYLWQKHGLNGKKRNKSGDYTISVHRDLLNGEVGEIFRAQGDFGSEFATGSILEAFRGIAFFVKEPPSVEGMVGNCTYLPNEKRAPKSSITAERFVALGKFFNTIILDHEGKEQKLIELKSIDELMTFAASKENREYKHLRKFLELNENQIFKGLPYKGKSKTLRKKEADLFDENKPEAEKKIWINLKGHAKFKEALGEAFESFVADVEKSDEVAKILTYYKSENQKREKLSKILPDTQVVEVFCKISFIDFNMLSIKTMRIVSQIMSDGYMRYDDALRYAIEKELLPKAKNEKSELLPPLKDTDIAILNPTVIRAFAQFRKIANALVRKHGTFDKVHFELAREVNTKDQIKQIKDGQYENEKERKEVAEWLNEYFAGQNIVPNRKNILKKRLYNDQDGRCVYTGETIKLERLFDDGYCEIDHILPKSRSADDSYANKALCLASANQEKTNKTPYEWLGESAKWGAFESRVDTSLARAKMGRSKIERLIKKNFDENSEKEFLERNLNDTRYMSKAIKAYCEKYWKLSHDDDKLRIQVRSGKLTSELRGRWIEGFMKDRSVHTHHALDAIVIAFSTQSMVQRLSRFYALKESRSQKEKPVFKPPFENFRTAVEGALKLEKTEEVKEGVFAKRLLVSRPPRAGVTGAAHKETIQSPKDYSSRGVVVNDGKGICDNGDMPRVDVFTKDSKYYLVPIYVADFAKQELPNKAIVAGKDKEWVVMDESYRFLFSLAKNDLVALKVKSKEEFFGYFRGTHSGTAGITVRKIDSDEEDSGIGSKTAIYIKKYTIDPLGYYHEVKNEKRLGTIPQMRKSKTKK